MTVNEGNNKNNENDQHQYEKILKKTLIWTQYWAGPILTKDLECVNDFFEPKQTLYQM